MLPTRATTCALVLLLFARGCGGALYAPVGTPLRTGSLKVDATHSLYYEVHGKPGGLPALFLHGGPGAGCTRRHAAFFDPAAYEVALLRACDARMHAHTRAPPRPAPPLRGRPPTESPGCRAPHTPIPIGARRVRVQVTLFDQRGCGKSAPRGCTLDNDTARLVADAEALRAHLGYVRWASGPQSTQ